MLNITKQKDKKVEDNNKSKKISSNKYSNYLDIVKHFPAATKEWCNSIYAYNKNSIKLLPVYDNIIVKLIKGYFNLYKTEINRLKTISSRFRKKLIRSSTNKIFISKAELKHTNNKVIIILYIYNEQERYLLNKLKKIDPFLGIKSKIFIKKINYIKLKGLNMVNLIKKEKLLLNYQENKLINKFRHHEMQSYKNFIRKSLRKDNLKKFYLIKLGFNKRKFDSNFLVPLNKLLNNIYNKKVEFNLVKLKYFYLNSDIFSQAMAIKIRKNKKLLKILKASLNLVKLPNLNRFVSRSIFHKLYITSITGRLQYFDAINTFINKNSLKTNTDVLHQLLQIFKNKKSINNYIETAVLRSINLKSVNGIRLEASGRLSRRFTASRSIFKVKYKGSLKNMNSSYKGLPSVMIRGNVKSNIQYTNITSKTRNGSFGLKGWISSN